MGRFKSDMFPKRETNRITRNGSDFFANLLSPLISPGSLGDIGEIFMDLPNFVYAICYILTATIFHPFIIGCFEFCINNWDGFLISKLALIIPLFAWGAIIWFSVLSIFDFVKWIKKMKALKKVSQPPKKRNDMKSLKQTVPMGVEGSDEIIDIRVKKK